MAKQCPFCAGPIKEQGDGPFATAECFEGHQFKADDALDGIQPRIPGWVFFNYSTATHLSPGSYIYNPELCDRKEASVGSWLLDYVHGEQYRACTVYWEINAPVPKEVILREQSKCRTKIHRLEILEVDLQDQIETHYPKERKNVGTPG